MSDGQDSEVTCKRARLLPFRTAISHRRGEDGFPPYWPYRLGDGLRPIPKHWGYACRHLRIQEESECGWVYLYYHGKLVEYSYQRSFTRKNVYGASGELFSDNLCTEAVGPKRPELWIWVPANAEGMIAFSEVRWSGERAGLMAKSEEERKKRMQPFNMMYGSDRMFPFAKARTIVEEYREYPNHLVCMGTELALTANVEYGALCYHALRSFNKLRVGNTGSAYDYDMLRMEAGISDAEHCYHYKDKWLADKFNEHTSWHAVGAVSPFAWEWYEDNGDFKLGITVDDMLKLEGQCIMLNDPIGMGRELSELAKHALDDEMFYLESIEYPHTIAKHLAAILRSDTDVSELYMYVNPEMNVFIKRIQRVFKRFEEYHQDLVGARNAVLLNGSYPCWKLMACIDDLDKSLTAREKLLADLVVLIIYKDFPEACKLVDDLCFSKDYNESVLWKCVEKFDGAVVFNESPSTVSVFISLYFLMLPTDAALAEKRIENVLRWQRALHDRNIISMADVTFNDAQVDALDDLLKKLFPDAKLSAPVLPGNHVYLTDEQREYVRGGINNFIKRPLRSRDSNLDRAGMTGGSYKLYVPEAMSAEFMQVIQPALSGSEAWAAILEMESKERNFTNAKIDLLRAYLFILSCMSLYRVIESENPDDKTRAAAWIGVGAGACGVLETAARIGSKGTESIYLPMSKRIEFAGHIFGMLGKLFTGATSAILCAKSFEDSMDAFEKGEYTTALQKSLETLAFGIGGFRFTAVGVGTAASIFGKGATAGLVAKKLGPKFLAKANPYIGALFIAAEIIAIYRDFSNGVIRWGIDSFWGNRNALQRDQPIIAVTPVTNMTKECYGKVKFNPSQKAAEEERKLFRLLYKPTVERLGQSQLLKVVLPGFDDEQSRFWLFWKGCRDCFHRHSNNEEVIYLPMSLAIEELKVGAFAELKIEFAYPVDYGRFVSHGIYFAYWLGHNAMFDSLDIMHDTFFDGIVGID